MFADDRTGALEVAGAIVARGVGSVQVVAGAPQLPGAPTTHLVVDTGSRLLPGGVSVPHVADGVRVAHKIDSTLRGHWAAELVARATQAPCIVVVVAALPDAGRVCAGGVVLVNGVPVHEGPAGRDPVHPVRSSRPADHLLAAGASTVAEVGSARALHDWLTANANAAAWSSEALFLVCDAATNADIEDIAAVSIGAEATLGRAIEVAGTAAVVAAVVAHQASAGDLPPARTARPARVPSVVVVSASLHPAARRQLARLVTSSDELDRVAVVVSPPSGRAVDPASATLASVEVAERARRYLARHPGAPLVVVGGDTAAAVLGDSGVMVHGMLAPGTPWGTVLAPGEPLVVTRSGGFGGDDSLVELVRSLLGEVPSPHSDAAQ